jgi:hypothetical protein
MPGMDDDIEGAMQQAPQFLRQSMITWLKKCEFSILHVKITKWA